MRLESQLGLEKDVLHWKLRVESQSILARAGKAIHTLPQGRGGTRGQMLGMSSWQNEMEIGEKGGKRRVIERDKKCV